MRSFISAAFEVIVRLSGAKKNYGTPENVYKHLENCRKISSKPYKIPPFSFIGSSLEKRTVNGADVYYLNKKSDAKHLILYLHSGSYAEQPLPPHWWFADRVAKKTDSQVIFPIYPKAPEHDFRETYELLMKLYGEMLEQTEPENIILLGDSCGGGLAISFALHLKELGLPLPAKVITCSPWLDMTMENPDITDKMKKHDPSLGINGLLLMGEKWANGEDRHSYMLSPMYGDLSGLCEITIIVGTGEFFFVDARKFRQKLAEANVPCNYYEYHKMHHAFILYPVPEAFKAQKILFEIINSNKSKGKGSWNTNTKQKEFAPVQ